MTKLDRIFFIIAALAVAGGGWAVLRRAEHAAADGQSSASAQLPAIFPEIVSDNPPPPYRPPPAVPAGPQTGPNILRGRAPDHPMAAPQAVSHVAVYAYRDQEIRVTRSGPWLRSERGEGREIEISNVHTGYSFDVVLSNGAPQALTARRSSAENDYYAYERIDTGARDMLLGETCRVWSWRRLSAHEHEALNLSCVTDDGVELWSRSENPRFRERGMRLLRVERKPIAEAEVAPAPEWLQWRTWFARAGEDAATTRGDYEVQLTSGVREPEITRILRKHRGWSYDDVRPNDDQRTVSISNGRLVLRYGGHYLQGGRELSILLRPPETPPAPRQPEVRLANPPPERILGERCVWYDTAPGANHFSHTECRTNDGLVLHAVSNQHVGLSWDVRAVRVRRTPLSPADVAPPLDVFAWLAPYAR